VKLEPTKLHTMLERATAPPDEAPADLDAETASLRHGWLGLCKLIEEEQASGDGFVNRVRVAQVAAARAEKRLEICGAAPQRNRATWSRWIAVSVAMAILVAAGATVVVRSLDGSGAVQPNSLQMARDNGLSKSLSDNRRGQSPFVERAPSPDGREQKGTVPLSAGGSRISSKSPADRGLSANRETATSNQADRQTNSTVDRLAWGDTVDDEITAVGQATTLAQHDWYGQSNSVSVIRSGLDKLENEVQQGRL
jgi:hypothetical protein